MVKLQIQKVSNLKLDYLARNNVLFAMWPNWPFVNMVTMCRSKIHFELQGGVSVSSGHQQGTPANSNGISTVAPGASSSTNSTTAVSFCHPPKNYIKTHILQRIYTCMLICYALIEIGKQQQSLTLTIEKSRCGFYTF